MRVLLNDNTVMHITDITEPMAAHDYECAWKGDIIQAGRKYVRVVYKLKDEFGCKHYCPSCWAEMNRD
jgi:hypothetical protein